MLLFVRGAEVLVGMDVVVMGVADRGVASLSIWHLVIAELCCRSAAEYAVMRQ